MVLLEDLGSSLAVLVVSVPDWGRTVRLGASEGAARLGSTLARLGSVLVRLGSVCGLFRSGSVCGWFRSGSLAVVVGSAAGLGLLTGLLLALLTGLALLLDRGVALLGLFLVGLPCDELGDLVLPLELLEPKLMWQPARPIKADRSAAGTRLRWAGMRRSLRVAHQTWTSREVFTVRR